MNRRNTTALPKTEDPPKPSPINKLRSFVKKLKVENPIQQKPAALGSLKRQKRLQRLSSLNLD